MGLAGREDEYERNLGEEDLRIGEDTGRRRTLGASHSATQSDMEKDERKGL